MWKARDTRLDRTVAIKFSQERFNERFEREARSVAALNHPNICQLYDIGPDYLVLEFVEGSPVTPVDSARKLLDIAVQIADGLSAAHAAGFTHRDLKPDNILITRDGRVKILDFGLAKRNTPIAETDETVTKALTNPGTVMGTIAYMSPEQARAQDTDARSDQFSFGVVLYELAMGKRPFQRGSAAETMTAIIREDAPPLGNNTPAPLRWIIERCLSKDPADRYDSTRDLYRELRQAKERLSDIVASAPAEAVPAAPAKRSRPVIPWMVAGVFAAALAALLWMPLPPTEPAQMEPFATEARIQMLPRWSPKGDRIAYVSDVDGVLQVFTRSVGSSTPTQITHEPEAALSPFWSADGSRIYYITGVRPATRLRSIAVAGGAAETLVEHLTQADLSPDGKTLAVMIEDPPGSYRLAFASPPSAPPKPYTQEPIGSFRTITNSSMAFDRSGNSLILGTGTGGSWSIPLNGDAPRKVSALSGSGGSKITLTLDGMAIQGTVPNTQTPQLWMTQPDGTPRSITSGGLRFLTPDLAPDGKTLAFSMGEADYDLVQVSLDGSGIRDTISSTRSEVAPAWNPDGTHFAYVTDRSGAPEIWLRNQLDKSEHRIVGSEAFHGATLLDLSFSPDGSRLAFRANPRGQAIWIAPVTGEAPAEMWHDPKNAPQRGPSWSPDGNSLAYYGTRDDKPAVMKMQVGSNATPEVLAFMQRAFPVRWSPRGDWVLYRDAETLRVVSPDGKQNKTISQGVWDTFGWSKDGRYVLGVVRVTGRRLSLRQVDVDSGRESQVSDLGPVPPEFDLGESLNEFGLRGFSLHPDGKSFLTSILRFRTDIYPMKDFDKRDRWIDRLLGR